MASVLRRPEQARRVQVLDACREYWEAHVLSNWACLTRHLRFNAVQRFRAHVIVGLLSYIEIGRTGRYLGRGESVTWYLGIGDSFGASFVLVQRPSAL